MSLSAAGSPAMSAADLPEGKLRLPELRPLDRRPGRAARPSVGGDELRQKCDGPLVCFPGPFFGGCTMCNVREDDLTHSGTRVALGRMHENWETGDVFCSADRRRVCDARFDEHVEEVEEEEDESAVSEREAESCGGSSNTRASASMPPIQERLEGRFHVRNPAAEAQDRHGLHQLLEAVMWNAGDLFVNRGWELSHKAGDRYSLNGRSIRLALLRPGLPTPPFAHLQKAVGFETAERAARITVADGSLRQPLMDYLMQTGVNERYDQRGTENIAGVTGAAKLLDFNVAGTDDRILEMKSAKIQADLRRSAGGEFERISALQSEGVKLLGGRPPSALVLGRSGSGPLSRWEAAAAAASGA